MFLGWYVFNKWNEGVYKNGEYIYCYKQVKSNKSVINNLVGYGIIVIGYKDAWFERNKYFGYLSFFYFCYLWCFAEHEAAVTLTTLDYHLCSIS